MVSDVLMAGLPVALREGDQDSVQRLIAELNPADIADLIEALTEQALDIPLLMSLDLQRRADTFGYLPITAQTDIAARLSTGALAELVTEMPSDERADLVKQLDESVRHTLFKRLAREEREDLRRLASYQEGSAGAVMTSDYASIPSGTRIADALDILRNTAPDKETIYQCYVVDASHRLLGTVSLKQLILAPAHQLIDELMLRDIVCADVDSTQEEVARLISRYDLIALPIVNHDETMVGIVTYDDAMDVAEAEATEDIHKGATVGRLETTLREASINELYRKRVGWLVVLVFANIFTGAGIAFFEDVIAANLALLFFLPLLVASAGNAGAQSATLLVRGLATGDVAGRDALKLLGREVLIAGALGLTMSAAVMAVGYLRAGFDVALVVSLTMMLVVMVGSLIGMVLPFVLVRFKFDPATASTPLITTIADVSGVLIYFAIASAMLAHL
ncbi:magnesium transporter [Alcanivorax sp. 1008]|uniref:magnesium transporter n=1 Tax=Alcanivorax sp. 1008 TaxID=2816853 RepID=UPI001D6A7AAC|nr:magnesium transporter [Alcanivorax sp. 1008]MCC1496122.1 magnesium transporter [Alcanivorax sp. 1008]